MRKTRRNGKLKVKLGKKLHTYKGLIRKLGGKKGLKVWKSKPKYHGGKLVCGNAKRRKARKASRKSRKSSRKSSGRKFLRVGGKRISWKGAVRKYGVKVAAKKWKKAKK